MNCSETSTLSWLKQRQTQKVAIFMSMSILTRDFDLIICFICKFKLQNVGQALLSSPISFKTQACCQKRKPKGYYSATAMNRMFATQICVGHEW